MRKITWFFLFLILIFPIYGYSEENSSETETKELDKNHPEEKTTIVIKTKSMQKTQEKEEETNQEEENPFLLSEKKELKEEEESLENPTEDLKIKAKIETPSKKKTVRELSKPRLGRGEEPLNSLVLTPYPLPEVTVDLPRDFEENSSSELETGRGEEEEVMLPKRVTPILTPSISEKTENLSTSVPPQDIKNEEKKGEGETQKIIPRTPSLHNVSEFVFSGLQLGMHPNEAIQSLREKGFEITKGQYGIPFFKTHSYKKKCLEKYHQVSQINECVLDLAKYENVYYIQSLIAKNTLSKEYIKLLFTSYATGNSLYKIYYENKGDNSIGWNQKAMASKLERYHGFWDLLFNLYGYPDDPDKLIWGDKEKVFMQAVVGGSPFNAYVVLYDKELDNQDYFEAEDDYKQNFKSNYSLFKTIGVYSDKAEED